MALGLIGKKIGMTQLFDEDGMVVPVTVIQAGPCPVVQRKYSQPTERVKKIKSRDGKVLEVKVKKAEGYDAVQLGYDESVKQVTKPVAGHFGSVAPHRYLKEFLLDNGEDAGDVGSVLTVEMFADVSHVDITGQSKGKGFQGVIRRHNFAGGPKTHGSHFKRAPGSIGQCAWPAKVFKGKKMPGRMGDEQVTVQSLKVVSVDPEKNLLIVKGSVPGSNNSVVYIKKSVKMG